MAAGSRTCQKILASGELTATASPQKSGAPVESSLALAPPADAFAATLVAGHPFLIRISNQHPPPTDLVVVLQHFTI